MSKRTDKNILKQYFRSGNRPTQKQFHELIDNCYNDAFDAGVSGYQVLVDWENNTISSMKREAGKTYVVPYFDRINIVHRRVYHYAIPCNVGAGHTLDHITLDMTFPQNNNYLIRDGRKDVNIKQVVSVEFIKVYNGSEEIHSVQSGIKIDKASHELQIKKGATRWLGIGIDIGLLYDLKSDIAVSDQLNIALEAASNLQHVFGSAGCSFIIE
jgi:hypothetical protein